MPLSEIDHAFLGTTTVTNALLENSGAREHDHQRRVSRRAAQSGLAAGVLGGGWVGAQCRWNRLTNFDIGGTSADIRIVVDGIYAETDARSTSIAGFPLAMPMLDIHTIDAGGGSIAHVDRGGAFRVGPQSAGAEPGPAAHGKGGTAPTMTDANLVLGRLEAEDSLGGALASDA